MTQKDNHTIEETIVVSGERGNSGKGRIRVRHYFPVEEARTKQAPLADCDINNIVNRQRKGGGILPELIREDARFGDFTDVPSYHDAMNRVAFAKEQFDALDARTRARFGNDPSAFLQFAGDPSNGEELVKMGLATKKTEPVDADAVLADKIGTAVAKHTTKKTPEEKPPKGDKP